MTSSVIDAFKGLNVAHARDLGDHEAIFEVSYQYLAKIKQFNDLDAFHNCLVALINTDKYYRAIQLIGEVPAEIHAEFPLEKAYVYYKTGKNDLLNKVYQATVTTSTNEVLARAMKHVMAQNCYQNGDVARALRLYHELIASNSIDSEVDMACNERAILSQVIFQTGATEKPVLSVADTYDIVFNNALIQLAQGDHSSSLSLLHSALAMCEDQNADADPADLALETLPIKLTIAYVYHVTGRQDQAVDVLESLDMADTLDAMVRLLFRNNLIAASPLNSNANFAARELNYHHNLHALRQKLTAAQSRVLLKNHWLLSYQTNTLSSSSKYVSNRFIREFSAAWEGDVTPSLYKVLLKLNITFEDLQDATQLSSVARKLYKYAHGNVAENSVTDDLAAAALLLVDVDSQSGKYDQSLLVLEAIVDKHATSVPASLVAALIELYEVSHSKKLPALYQTLVAGFRTRTADEIKQDARLYKLILAVAVKLLVSAMERESAELLQLLASVNPDDVVVSSILSSNTDKLLPVEKLEAEADVEDLLAINVEDLAPAPAVSGVSKQSREPQYKVSKKRKPKFSQHKFFKPASDFNADTDLDKERWLPMKLRSYYKPSKKELKKKSGGHQGAVESSPAAQPVAPASSKSKKKKKKGKK